MVTLFQVVNTKEQRLVLVVAISQNSLELLFFHPNGKELMFQKPTVTLPCLV